MNYIKSPINYTGNKYRLLKQFELFIPSHTKTFVDLFCGGATVGFNVNADKIVLIDNNPRVINLLKCLAEKKINKIISAIELLIEDYNLSYSYKYTFKYYRDSGYVVGNNGLKAYNEQGYYKLREDYNLLKNKKTFKANMMLYVLMVYGFNNDIRFNGKGEFNLPVGKTDFNKSNYTKLIEYNERAQKICYEFVCADFKSQEVKEILLNSDFVYCDPPYLITNAVYNENNGWSENDENDLLKLLSELDTNKIKFALSNVLEKKGVKNNILSSWVNNNRFDINDIDYNYKSSSYNKNNRDANEREVLITNYNAK